MPVVLRAGAGWRSGSDQLGVAAFMQSPEAEWPVLSGWLPPGAGSSVSRQETGLSPASSLPAGETVVLVPGETASGQDLRGLGGTGKTTVAASVAQAHWRHRMVDLVVWVTGSGPDAVVSGYAQALRDIGLPAAGDPEQAAASFLGWLQQTRQPWLVVVDDLSDPAVVAELWPRGPGGRVLVTTEYPDLADQMGDPRLMAVGPYSPREALAYLFAKLQADPSQRAGAVDLAHGLGLLPLALAQAAAVMAETGMDCREYLARAAEGDDSPGRAGGMPAQLARQALALSAGYADQLPPAGLAGRVLAFISMLSPRGIPGALLTGDAAQTCITGRAAGEDGSAAVRAAAHNLARAGLVSIDASSAARTVLVHPVVQAAIRLQLPAAEQDRIAKAVAEALSQAWLWPDMPLDIAQALRDCTAQLRDVSGSALWASESQLALLRAGQSLDSSHMPRSAVAYWRTLLGISQQGLGPDHAQTALVRDMYGSACRAAGRFDEAITVYEHELTDSEHDLGPRSPGTLAARLKLTRAYRAASRPDDAVPLAKQAAADYDDDAGPAHPDTLAAQEELVRACLVAGRHSEAVTAAAHIRTARERALGSGHPDTLAAADLLVDAYLAAGRFKQAIAACRRAVADRERAHEPGHQATIAARTRLALAYRMANKPKDAIGPCEQVLADREQAQGPDHPDTINSRAELALTCYAARRLPQSIKHYERVVADCERVFGPGHPRTLRAQEDLAEAAAGAQSILGIDLRSPAKRD